MSIKTILLHMSNDGQHTTRLRVGVGLARRFNAYLEVLYITTPASMPAAGRGASYAFIAEATAIAYEKAGQVEHEVRLACCDVSYSWQVSEGSHAQLLAARAPYVDLALVSQLPQVHAEDRVLLHLPDELPLAAACPTLVLPPNHSADDVPGHHVLVAWKNTREAGRAVRDALPLLQAAEKVTVLTIDPPGHRGDSAHDMMIFLERHGVRSQHRSNIASDDTSGEVILDVARDLDCDCIAMGAYGHSRLRELVLGGTTRYVLTHMDRPVLMAH